MAGGGGVGWEEEGGVVHYVKAGALQDEKNFFVNNNHELPSIIPFCKHVLSMVTAGPCSVNMSTGKCRSWSCDNLEL